MVFFPSKHCLCPVTTSLLKLIHSFTDTVLHTFTSTSEEIKIFFSLFFSLQETETLSFYTLQHFQKQLQCFATAKLGQNITIGVCFTHQLQAGKQFSGNSQELSEIL